MKLSATLLGLAASASAHTIFQKVSVNGQDQGQLKGVRAPSSDYPLMNVNDGNFACNTGIQFKDNTVITVPAGARVGAWWGHVIGGAQGANDADNPIARSHKGPIMVYLAKVDNAATAGTAGLRWFKVAESGLNGGTWAVDTMISNGGWHYFNMPSCVAPGDYLMRVELIALHSAQTQGQAQFYMECAQYAFELLTPLLPPWMFVLGVRLTSSFRKMAEFASPAPAPRRARTLSTSPAPTRPTTPASRSTSTTIPATRTEGVGPTRSPDRPSLLAECGTDTLQPLDGRLSSVGFM
jgi:cellulase